MRAVVLTDVSNAFPSGGNVKTLRDQVGSGLGLPALSRHAYRDGIQRLPLALYNLDGITEEYALGIQARRLHEWRSTSAAAGAAMRRLGQVLLENRGTVLEFVRERLAVA